MFKLINNITRQISVGAPKIRSVSTTPTAFGSSTSDLGSSNWNYDNLVNGSSPLLSKSRNTTTVTSIRKQSTSADVKVPDLHEPAYLADLKPKVGYYDLLNLQLNGYDFAVLEKYEQYLDRAMRKMDFNIVSAWAAPYQELKIETLTPEASSVEHTYTIKIYERNFQLKEALVTKLPILIDLINMTSPPGVSFSIKKPSPTDDDKIHFEDSVLSKLKEELQELKSIKLIGE